MYDEKEVEDSLAFCREIKFYYESGLFENPQNIFSLETYKGFVKKGFPILEDTQSVQMEEHIALVIPKETAEERKELEEESYFTFGTIVRRTIESFACIILAFCIAFFFNHFIGTHTTVEGSSMETSLHNEDCLLIDKLTYRFKEPNRFDIIVFPYDETTYYIKRIIGMPGERIKISEGNIYINDNLLEEEYGNQKIKDAGIASQELLLGNDEYFVLGDNRNQSKDSRFKDVGFIKRDKIIGKAFGRIYPFQDICVFQKK